MFLFMQKHLTIIYIYIIFCQYHTPLGVGVKHGLGKVQAGKFMTVHLGS